MPEFSTYTGRTLELVLRKIEQAIYTIVGDLTMDAWRTHEPTAYDQRTAGEPLHPHVGEPWGALFDCAWFRFRGVVPESAA